MRQNLIMFQFIGRFAARAVPVAVFLSLFAAIPGPAHAVPALQVYIEGATYDDDDETWVITSPANAPLRFWAVGNVEGPGGHGELHDVRAAFAYSSGAGEVAINIVPSTTGGYGGFVDPSVPGVPSYLGTHTDGSSPVLASGKSLAPHGIYGGNTVWQEWGLGNFGLTDSPIADFIDAFPNAPIGTSGQINAYEIFFAGLEDGESVHIDLYGYNLGSNNRIRAVFAPFSHDGSYTQSPFDPNPGNDSDPIPEPGIALLLAGGCLWMAVRRRRNVRAN
ncbi:MAG: choice-of-anchor N protein [Rhodospirillaceae bacterium]